MSLPGTWIWVLSQDDDFDAANRRRRPGVDVSCCEHARRAGESLVLLGSLLFATLKIHQTPSHNDYNSWVSRELGGLLAASVLYILYTYSAIVSLDLPPPPRAPTPTLTNSRNARSQTPTPPMRRSPADEKAGFLWMSVPKNYRPSTDDGILTAVLLGPLVAAALLCTSLHPTIPTATIPSEYAVGLPQGWAIEPPFSLPGPSALSPQESLLLGRYAAVNLGTLTSAILLVHVCAAAWLESRTPKDANVTADTERRSVPRSEVLRGALFLAFMLAVSGAVFLLRVVFRELGVGIWRHLSPFDTLASALFYQVTLYVALRMAHRGFTLGELGFVCFGGSAIFIEGLSISKAALWPLSTPYIKSFRLPTPLVIFQTVLVGGPFLVGFLLAPLLVLSRHAAQTPVRRRRRPPPAQAPTPRVAQLDALDARRITLLTRRRLALALLFFTLLIVTGPIGLWARWALRSRDPWLWAIRWVLARRRRAGLLSYWAALGGVSVAGWMRQLARGRRWRGESMGMNININMNGMGAALNGMVGDTSALFAASGEFLDRAPTLGLNARRKYFHGLVVVMFVPGIAFDPAFTHLAFSVAFALFVFAEYVRYFAIYPLGAAIHLFMNEFLDTKDGGTAILSHFYLLTGCAGALWLEGPSRLLSFTGLLVLGIGDALASIVGKRLGRHAWSPTTAKTLEGSAAFVVAVVASAWALRLCGLAESFATVRYVLVIMLAAVLEALSDQNDNLTLPLFTWSALVLADVVR
ncbi:hypothetical protein FB45DRAFT_986576 [Roridomyces roridus]|uniref:dolichol kinase n=1 Tax=Roridomyces roridus TaxID=1738132 RepID=A0AAD7FYT1_9AGAR|nr:hypothetical protein FB45DRAFT_986576 [Roridomyces roridus]